MHISSLIMLALAQPATGEPLPLNEIQQQQLSCVATLAIVITEQERGVASALEYPPLDERGAVYLGRVGKGIMDDNGRSREQVHQDLLAAVAAQQALGQEAADPEEVVAAQMETCLPLLDAAVPPKPKPGLNQCAGLLQLAYEEVHDREGLSKTAQDLKTLASVLDSRARDKMRAEGLSGRESDIMLAEARETMLADAQKDETIDQVSDLDIEHCFTLAAPEDRQRKYEH